MAKVAGWNSKAIECMAECGASIRESRNQDEANDYKIGKLAMALIKEENNIGEDGKKIRDRKRAARPIRETAPARKSVKITIVRCFVQLRLIHCTPPIPPIRC